MGEKLKTFKTFDVGVDREVRFTKVSTLGDPTRPMPLHPPRWSSRLAEPPTPRGMGIHLSKTPGYESPVTPEDLPWLRFKWCALGLVAGMFIGAFGRWW